VNSFSNCRLDIRLNQLGRAQKINLGKNEQKEPWFIKLNPNGRIPVLIDHTRNDFPVFESGAILTYLQTHHDRDGLFGFPRGSNDESEMLQWIFFAVCLQILPEVYLTLMRRSMGALVL
jgi:glutathione S-transferase